MTIQLEIVQPHAEIVGFAKEHPEEWAQFALKLVEECGRVSHKSEGRIKPGSANPFIRKVAINWGHESILEHASLTVCFVGSRSMSHQLVRHRIASYTQESQRYCDYSDGGKHDCLKVVLPPSIGVIPTGTRIRYNDKLNLIRCNDEIEPLLFDINISEYLRSIFRAYNGYLRLRKNGIPAEDARELLPNATKTEVYTTFNLRQWRHFFSMRLDSHAQWQIKMIAKEIFKFLNTWCPIVLENLKSHSGDILDWDSVK